VSVGVLIVAGTKYVSVGVLIKGVMSQRKIRHVSYVDESCHKEN